MINRNLNGKKNSYKNPQLPVLEKKSKQAVPFLLKPIGKDYLWGGNRLNLDFSKGIRMQPLAETWECSTHPDGISIVSSGIHAGRPLTQVLAENPHYMGRFANAKGELPYLVKLIDAKQDLSVQVHPGDTYAREHENGSLGKTEMWYVLDAAKDARLIYGFCHDMDKRKVKDSILAGTIEKYLQKIRIHKDDVFFIPPGQVHSIGAGSLIAEIQENSNITYRLYDYGRTDKSGNERELHIDKALEVASLESSRHPRQPIRVLKFRRGYATEFLCRCKYFQVERMIINTKRRGQIAHLETVDNLFQVLLCTEGCGVLFWDAGDMINFFCGDCIFIPANAAGIRIHGQATMLKIC